MNKRQKRKELIPNAVEKLKEVNKGTDIETIKQCTEKLKQVWSKVSEKVYQQTQENTAEKSAASDNSNNASDDNIEDADFEVVEDEAK